MLWLVPRYCNLPGIIDMNEKGNCCSCECRGDSFLFCLKCKNEYNSNLSFESGRIYGIVGRNGSGKTMLFRAIAGLMRLDSGQVSIDGQVLHQDIEVVPNLGILLENAGLYTAFTGYKNLALLAEINNRIGAEDGYMMTMNVAELPEELAGNICDTMRELLPESSYIIRVRGTGEGRKIFHLFM